MEAYCAALEKEIRLTAKQYSYMPVDTVFLGGGTPSVLPPELMKDVLTALHSGFTVLPDAEFTSEANPGTITAAWLATVKAAGVNRLSIGVQAIQPHLMASLGRIHTFEQAQEVLHMARSHGITNLNADAMFGLPGQTLSDYLATLDALAEQDVTHISAYSLIVEEGTPLAAQIAQGTAVLPDEDTTADMLENGVDRLAARGYERYEISNFAKPGYACKHNLGYWRQKPYLGLGLAAASLLPPEKTEGDNCYIRRQNTDDMQRYVHRLSQNQLPAVEETPVRKREAMFETIMLGLRTVAGVGYDDFQGRYGIPLTAVYGDAIRTLTAQGLLQPVHGVQKRLALTRRGLALQNTAMMAFMPTK